PRARRARGPARLSIGARSGDAGAARAPGGDRARRWSAALSTEVASALVGEQDGASRRSCSYRALDGPRPAARKWRMAPHRAVIASVALAVVGLAGCGDDDDTSGPGSGSGASGAGGHGAAHSTGSSAGGEGGGGAGAGGGGAPSKFPDTSARI